jgi:hypothetical protein
MVQRRVSRVKWSRKPHGAWRFAYRIRVRVLYCRMSY